MIVEVLGQCATAPTLHGAASGYVVHTTDGMVIVDAGPGSMAAFTSRHDIDDVRALVITHMHADHSLDLMAWAYRWTYPIRRDPIALFAPAGAEPALDAFDSLFGIPTLPTMHAPVAQSFERRVLPLDGSERFVVGGAELVSFAARHAVPSAALRFELGGRAIAFSSDTGDCDGVRAAAAGADVFVCEATWLDAPDDGSNDHGHLTADEAGRIASEAGVDTLVLTHFEDPGRGAEAKTRAQRWFEGRIEVAEPGLRL